jgi:hypothetical protein
MFTNNLLGGNMRSEYGHILQQRTWASHSSLPFVTILKPPPFLPHRYRTCQSLSMTHATHTSWGWYCTFEWSAQNLTPVSRLATRSLSSILFCDLFAPLLVLGFCSSSDKLCRNKFRSWGFAADFVTLPDLRYLTLTYQKIKCTLRLAHHVSLIRTLVPARTRMAYF